MEFIFDEQTNLNLNSAINNDIIPRKKRKLENQSKISPTTSSIGNIKYINEMNLNPYDNSSQLSDAFVVNTTPQSRINLPPRDVSNATFLIKDNTYGNDSVSYIYNSVCDTTAIQQINDSEQLSSNAHQTYYTDRRNNIHTNIINNVDIYPTPEGRPILNTSLVKLAAHNNHHHHQYGSKATRSPLTPMVNNIVMKNSSTTNLDPLLPFVNKKHYQSMMNVSATDNNDFFLYNEKYTNETEEDYFAKLSDEMILAIFKYLPKKALNRCSYVCRRFSNVVQDETLWIRMDLASKHIQPGATGHILSRGVVILRLAQAKILSPLFEPFELYTDFYSKLQYFDLSMATISKPDLKILLSKCRKLKKISLEHVPIDVDICKELACNKNLEALNLTMCEGIDADCIRLMMIALKSLQNLNISWTSLDGECVRAFVENVPNNLLRLNIAGCRKSLNDLYLSLIVKRCPLLTELDLSDCTLLTGEAIPIICELKKLEYLSLSRCYNIPTTLFVNLRELPSLMYLDIFSIVTETSINTLKKSLPSIVFNQFIHSSVGRPTVGNRRTSIWGMRTRD